MTKIPLWRRYARFFGSDLKEDVREELLFHLEEKTEDLIARGLSPEAARQKAMQQFGDLKTIQDIGEQMGEKMERRRNLRDYCFDTLQDIRFTIRTLRRDIGFASVAILILAIAIGANIAVFSVINTLLLQPLPFPQSKQLVWIAPPPAPCGLSCETYSSDAFEEFRERSKSYEDVTGYFAFSTADNVRLMGHGEPVPATNIDVIDNFFQVLGVQPKLGRLFRPEDSHDGAAPVIVISEAWWKRQFAADPNIVGKSIDLNDRQFTVIGVLPASFDFGSVFAPGSKVDAFTALNLNALRRSGNIVTFIGRLKPSVTLAQAQEEAKRLSPDIYFSVRHPDTKGNYKGRIIPVPLKDWISGRLRTSLIVLWSAVGMILLIACVNLSSLTMVRMAARSKEFAMRGALGASRGRIVRQLLAESFLLSGIGAVLGLGLAWGLVSWLAHQGSVALPLLGSLTINRTVFGWTIAIAALSAIFFGVIPGLRIARGNLQEVLKDSGAGAGKSRKQERTRSILVITELGLACLLLIGAGLLLRSFIKVQDIDLGFQPERAAAIKVDYKDNPADGNGDTPESNRAITARRTAFYREMLTRVSSIPGVQMAGLSDNLPLDRNRSWGPLIPKGETRPEKLPSPLVYMITPGYLHSMGMRLKGRDFSWSDSPDSEKVIIVNQAIARYYWPNEDAVGKVVSMSGSDRRIIGVLDDVHQTKVEGGSGWQVYFPDAQGDPGQMYLVVRTNLPPAALASAVMHVLREMNPNQPAAEFRPIQNLVDHANSPRRFFMILVASFAGLGLLLASLGAYGVISYSVTQRKQEIGVRMALGATPWHVRRQILVKTLLLAVVGVMAGTLGALCLSQVFASLLYQTSPRDITTYLEVTASLTAVALVAGFLPAWRASRLQPNIVLRCN